jgi:hypothetical protein
MIRGICIVDKKAILKKILPGTGRLQRDEILSLIFYHTSSKSYHIGGAGRFE